MSAELCSHQGVLGENLLPRSFRLLAEYSSCVVVGLKSPFSLTVGNWPGVILSSRVTHISQLVAPSMFKPAMEC